MTVTALTLSFQDLIREHCLFVLGRYWNIFGQLLHNHLGANEPYENKLSNC